MSMFNRFLREVASAGLPAASGPVDMVTRSQIASLPEPAQRYFRFMKVDRFQQVLAENQVIKSLRRLGSPSGDTGPRQSWRRRR